MIYLPKLWNQNCIKSFQMILIYLDCYNSMNYRTESQQVPQFTTEILDARVQETETATFECFFAGNPKPGKMDTDIHL